MNTPLTTAFLSVAIAALLSACSPPPPAEPLRTVRTAEIRYDKAQETHRYTGTVQARHEVDQAFRVGGKILARKVDVGHTVREGDVLAMLDETDYRLAEEAARQQHLALETQARQAQSDRRRNQELIGDGAVSSSEDEHTQSGAIRAQAAAEAAARQLELARNRLKYTVLRASRSGVVTAVRAESGQVVAEGQPVVAIANPGEPEIVVDVPEDQLAAFKTARYSASLTSAPDATFEVALRELGPQAAAQTRTYRARLKPATPRPLPLGATATLVARHAAAEEPVAAIPASAITQANGQPALWVVRRDGAEPVATVHLAGVTVYGYRNDEVLVSGLPAGTRVVTAGVQKMAPGLRVALPGAAGGEAAKQAAR
ncbi:MAG TPA: efflux RND transporter periplasmic adaptor subunit [Burkholderiales bacterium]|nr:efflux RND transporter periplasmic adaptor subunit [Burkholderiales bacterium]